MSSVTDSSHLSDLAPPAMIRSMGWYPDPSKAADLRWWNGTQWTDNVRPLRPGSPDSLTVWGVILGLLLPIVGFVIGIVLLTRNRVGPGLGVLAASVLGVVVFLALTGS